MDEDVLSFSDENYRAVYKSIEALYHRFRADGLGVLLSDMPYPDAIMWDPAFPGDYRALEQQVGRGKFELVPALIRQSLPWADTDGKMSDVASALANTTSEEYRVAREVWDREQSSNQNGSE